MVALGVILTACAGGTPVDGISSPHSPSSRPGAGRYGQATLIIRGSQGEVRVRVEVADTPEEQARGLMFRDQLPPDAGMVFIHEESGPGTFWMKDTRIPLSLAVWGPEGRILAILNMEPCRTESCPSYDPGVAWIGAVEVNQGFFEDSGVEVGDSVRIET
jgi:uncharacterized membrane protein (UPF0127 family)